MTISFLKNLSTMKFIVERFFLLEDKRYSVYLKNREKLQGLEKPEIATLFRRRISQIYKR